MKFGSKYFEDKKELCHEVLTEAAWTRRFLRGKTIFDVACGTGRHGYLLQYYGYEITYLDVSKDAIEQVWWTDRKLVDDFLAHDFKKWKFDNVISFQFIEHLNLEQFRRALFKMKELARYRVINTTPHPKHVEFRKDPTHYYRPDRNLVNEYLSIMPNTEIYRYDNKFRGDIEAWVRGFLERLIPHYFENLIFVTYFDT